MDGFVVLVAVSLQISLGQGDDDVAELLMEFSEPVANSGIVYKAQACGAPVSGNLWEGWIEFLPLDGGQSLRSGRETTQPNREDAVYWATGLTPVYLEGALARALNPVVRTVATPSEPLFNGPAASMASAVLNPFSVAEKGEGLLRQELSALSSWHLVNIVRAYDLSEGPIAALNRLSASSLVDLIVEGVRSRRSGRG